MTIDAGKLTLICEQWEEARRRGQNLTAEELCADHPELLEDVRRAVRNLAAASANLTTTVPGTVTAAGDPTLPPGCRYSLVRFLAEGGLGRVYVGFDTELKREVAIKFVHPNRLSADDAVRRFQWEAEVTGQLEHPGIAPMHGLIRDPATGQVAYAMRLLRGQTLQESVDRFHADGGIEAQPARFRALLADFARNCRTVGFAHGRGFLHRDLKPSNVMTGTNGESWVLDWGLAKALKVIDPAPTVPAGTREGQILGTPAYMAPEQASGELERLGPAADVYALGGILFFLLTGKPPHHGSTTAAVLTQALNAAVPPARKLNPAAPAELDAVCRRALAKEPADRYPSAAAVAEAVEAYLGKTSVEPPRTWPRRRVAIAAGLLVFAAAVSGVIVVKIRNKDGIETEIKVHDGGAVTVVENGQTVAVVPAANDPEREAAELLKPHGFDLRLRMRSGEVRNLGPKDPLPAEPFTLERIGAWDFTTVPADFLGEKLVPALIRLRGLDEINDTKGKLGVWTDRDLLRLADSPAGAGLTILRASVPLTPRNVQAVERFPKLNSMRWTAENAGDEELEGLKSLPKCATLELSDLGLAGRVTDKGWAAVTELPVTGLLLWKPAGLDARRVKQIVAMSRIENFTITSDDLTDAMAAELAKSPSLHGFGFFECPRVTDVTLDVLTPRRDIWGVGVTGTKVTEERVKKFAADHPETWISWAGGTIEPTAPADPGRAADVDRGAAVALRKHGFELTIRQRSGAKKVLTPVDPLPMEPFVLVRVNAGKGPRPVNAKEITSAVVAAVADLRSLEELNDDFNRFGLSEDEVERLAAAPVAATLSRLGMGIDFGPRALDSLKRFPRLTAIRLNCSKADDALLARLKELPGLTELYLGFLGRSGRVTQQGWQSLAGLPLTDLLLRGSSGFDVRAARAVAGMPELTSISIDEGLTDDHVAALAELPKGTSIDLGDSLALTDAAFDALARRKSALFHVVVHKSKVTAAGVKKLAEAHPECGIEWDGGYVPQSQALAADRAAAEALRKYGFELTVRPRGGKNVTLKPGDALPADAFRLVGVVVPPTLKQFPAGFVATDFLPMIAPLSGLESLTDSHERLGRWTETEFIKLAGFPLATTLNDMGVPVSLTPGSLDAAKSFPKLAFIHWKAEAADDALLDRLKELPTVIGFQVSGLGRRARVTEVGWKSLTSLPLKSLLIYEPAQFDLTAARLIGGMPNLENISVTSSGVTDEMAAEVIRGPKVQSVLLECPKVTDAILERLGAKPKLYFANLTKAKVTEAGVKKLAAAHPECLIGWDGGVIQPKAADVERDAAETLRKHGAELTLRLPAGDTRVMKSTDLLPAEPFAVVGIVFNTADFPNGFVRETLLPTLQNIRSLTRLCP